MNETDNNTVVFKGYLAELIRVLAEKEGKTPEAFVLSFFEVRCNAPTVRTPARLRGHRDAIFCKRGALHPAH